MMSRRKKQITPRDPVIQFVGKAARINAKTGKPEMVLRTAPPQILNGGKTIDLPGDAEQKKGFTHADALFLLKNYPRQYKRKVTKEKGK